MLRAQKKAYSLVKSSSRLEVKSAKEKENIV